LIKQEQAENALETASIEYLLQLVAENNKEIENLTYQNIGFQEEIDSKRFWRDTNDL